MKVFSFLYMQTCKCNVIVIEIKKSKSFDIERYFNYIFLHIEQTDNYIDKLRKRKIIWVIKIYNLLMKMRILMTYN